MTIRDAASRAVTSVVFYPLTAFYCAAVLTAVGISQRWFSLDWSIIALTLFGIFLLLLTMHQEVTVVHKQVVVVHDLVNSQRDELVERIEQLLDTLDKAQERIEQLLNTIHEAGISVPDKPSGQRGEIP